MCHRAARRLWTWRDPAAKPNDRYHGHGVLDVCADCLAASGGPDYRDKTLGDVLHNLRPTKEARS